MPRADAPVGIGLKTAHLPRILGGERVELGFFEVHAENAMSAGGPLPERLTRLRERFALSIHGVGLSIGGEAPLDAAHLRRLGALVQRYEPRWFSEHLAWSSHGGAFFNDLLPMPYTVATLRRTCVHIDQLQSVLRRTILLENPSTYVEFAASSYGEAEFIAELQRRTGCALLLDVNNAYVSAVNHGRDARAFIAALPLHAVQEIHLAGHAEDRDGAGDRLLIDTHGTPVADAVWALYAHTLERTGPLPTLIERDHDLPSFETLQAEALQAAALMRQPAAPPTIAWAA
ncbi:MAG: DUF692 domain-containing protein [Rubrivivax sp.]